MTRTNPTLRCVALPHALTFVAYVPLRRLGFHADAVERRLLPGEEMDKTVYRESWSLHSE